MASVLKFLLKFLCKTPCKLWGSIPHCFNFKSWAPFLAFLGRRFGLWRQWNKRKGTFRRDEQAEYSFPDTGALSGVNQDHPIACVRIPASAQLPNQRLLAGSSRGADLGSAHRSGTSLSIHSRASDRLSIIQSHSHHHEFFHPPPRQAIGHPNLKAAHRQFGYGPSTDRLVSSHPPAVLSPTGVLHRHNRGPTSTSVVMGIAIENPSTESLPRSQSVDSPTLPEEPYSIGSPIVHSSPASNPPKLPEETPQLTPTASLTFSLDLPDGRFLQMIISEQVPRYTKSVTVQVNIIISPSKSYVFWQTSREEELRY